jgi:hypothetical protein
VHEAELLAADVADALDLLPDVVLADRLDASSSGLSRPFDCRAVQVIGWPCDNSGGDPAASDAMILPSRSVQASPSASTLMPGCFASKRRAMSLNALMVCGSVSVCQTRTTLSCAEAGTAKATISPAASAAIRDVSMRSSRSAL